MQGLGVQTGPKQPVPLMLGGVQGGPRGLAPHVCAQGCQVGSPGWGTPLRRREEALRTVPTFWAVALAAVTGKCPPLLLLSSGR